MSFVLTASSKFNETLDSIVKELQESGFSKDDYYAEEAPKEELIKYEILTKDLFAEDSKTKYATSDKDFDISAIEFNPNEKVTLETIRQQNPLVSQITDRAKEEGKNFEQRVSEVEVESLWFLKTR